MSDLDREVEALRLEARKKIAEEAAERERLLDAAPPPAHSGGLGGCPGLRAPGDGERPPGGRPRGRTDDRAGEGAPEDAAFAAADEVARLARLSAALAPGALAKGHEAARRAAGLSAPARVGLVIVGLSALVLLWKLVLQPLVLFAIFVSVIVLVVLLLSKVFGKAAASPDEED